MRAARIGVRDRGRGDGPRAGISTPRTGSAGCRIVRLAIAVGERDAAEAATRLAIDDPQTGRLPLRRAVATACRGLLAGDPAPLLEAAELYRSTSRILDCGVALENAAVLLGERGQVPEARDAIAAAVEEYTKLGAAWDITRAEARMRPFGIRRGQRGPRDRRPSSGWDGADPDRAAGGVPGGRRAVESGDRGRAVLVPADGADARVAHPGEAGCPVAGRGRQRGG